MRVPFTPSEFFEVFTRYNEAIWPMQPVLVALAVLTVLLVNVRAEKGSRAVSWILVFFWVWMAVAYHFSHFASINPAAKVFGVLFVIQALLFAWAGGVRSCLSFQRSSGINQIVGWVLVVYALVVYPLLGSAAGHSYMSSPTFGVPCPTTIFTFGVLWFARRPLPRYVLVAPIVWSAIGGSAAFILDVPQDIGLVVSGATGLILLFAGRQS